MTVLSAFMALLQRYAGQTDVVVGTPISGRHRQELEGIIGLFVNTLVVRADVSGDPSFAELLGRVKQTLVQDYLGSNPELPRLSKTGERIARNGKLEAADHSKLRDNGAACRFLDMPGEG